jgi:calmodulin
MPAPPVTPNTLERALLASRGEVAPLQEKSQRHSGLPPGARRSVTKRRVSVKSLEAFVPRTEAELRREAGLLYVAGPRLTDEQICRAKSKFFEIDRDGSGSIDKEELVAMMHGLGVEPGDDEIERMLDSADTGEKDGKIDLREFLRWYAKGTQHQTDALKADTADAYRLLTSSTLGAKLPKEKLRDFMSEEYGLEYDLGEIDTIFSSSFGPDMEFDDFATTMMTSDRPVDELKVPTLERGLGCERE